ncbi:putative sterol-4-alpha-carboxylate 3-dehydrogenase, decarboxylating [Rhypophila sp. PSN 637]
MSPETEPVCLGNVLVVGGCGFLGHHIVKQLLSLPYPSQITSVTVMSRNPTKNLLTSLSQSTGIPLSYHQGDITSPQDVSRIVNLCRPKTVINSASPVAYLDHLHAPDYEKVNVQGNQNLLSSSASIGTVKAYIYTSSAPIIAGSGGSYNQADETHPTLADLPPSRHHDPYHLAKARGDALVLRFNNSPLPTCTIRPTAMYGVGDNQMILNLLTVFRQHQQTVYLGSNTALMDSVHVSSVAHAHILAAQSLLSPSPITRQKVSGQAFNITDNAPLPPWTFFRLFWYAMGDTTPLSKIWTIPDWFVLGMADIAEWITWLTSLGKYRPKLLVKERIEFLVYTRTYNIQKARERLGFEPEEWPESTEGAEEKKMNRVGGFITGVSLYSEDDEHVEQ